MEYECSQCHQISNKKCDGNLCRSCFIVSDNFGPLDGLVNCEATKLAFPKLGDIKHLPRRSIKFKVIAVCSRQDCKNENRLYPALLRGVRQGQMCPSCRSGYKSCPTCGECKQITEFHKHSGRRCSSYCQSCTSIRNGKNNQINKEQRKKYNQQYYKKNEIYLKEQTRLYRENQSPNKQKRRNEMLKSRYKIDPIIFEKLKAFQNDKCAICKEPFIPGKKICVDHDHVTKKVRGLLCPRCNLHVDWPYDKQRREFLTKTTADSIGLYPESLKKEDAA